MRIDLKREWKRLYTPRAGEFEEVDVPPMRYLAIDGQGDPNTTQRYAEAVSTLYTVGYGVRAAFKGRTGDDFIVGPLEGLWYADDPTVFARGDRSSWHWTMLIPLPGSVSGVDVEEALVAAAGRMPGLPVDEVRLLELHEGRSIQTLHIGGYDTEGPTLARLHDEVMPGLGVTFGGPHHEIYLSDPRKVAPEKLRTILRQPVLDIA